MFHGLDLDALVMDGNPGNTQRWRRADSMRLPMIGYPVNAWRDIVVMKHLVAATASEGTSYEAGHCQGNRGKDDLVHTFDPHLSCLEQAKNVRARRSAWKWPRRADHKQSPW